RPQICALALAAPIPPRRTSARSRPRLREPTRQLATLPAIRRDRSKTTPSFEHGRGREESPLPQGPANHLKTNRKTGPREPTGDAHGRAASKACDRREVRLIDRHRAVEGKG